MQYKSVKQLIKPLIKAGHKWQSISLNGDDLKSTLYFSNIQWTILLFSALVLLKLPLGISSEVIGYVMGAFSITVSLFMSLLVSIFDKFENTNFNTIDKTDEQVVRLIQKKNFFKRFISITSYLVVLSILIIVLCSLTFLIDSLRHEVTHKTLVFNYSDIDLKLTIKSLFIVIYRVILNYFLLNYLFLTFFITGSAFEYYMSEMNAVVIKKN